MQAIHLPRQGDLLPGGAQLAHVDRNQAGGGPAGGEPDGVQQAGLGLDGAALAPGLRHDQRSDAARGVAAGLDLAAVGVADAHEDVGGGILRRLQDDQLIAADALATIGNAARGRIVQREGLAAGVDYDEVVAQAMHLDEGAALEHEISRIWPAGQGVDRGVVASPIGPNATGAKDFRRASGPSAAPDRRPTEHPRAKGSTQGTQAGPRPHSPAKDCRIF